MKSISLAVWMFLVAAILLVLPWSIKQYEELESESPAGFTPDPIDVSHYWPAPGASSEGVQIDWLFYPTDRFESPRTYQQMEVTSGGRICLVRGELRNRHSEAHLLAKSVELIVMGPRELEFGATDHSLGLTKETGYRSSEIVDDDRLPPGGVHEFQFEFVVPDEYLRKMVGLSSKLSYQFETAEGKKYAVD